MKRVESSVIKRIELLELFEWLNEVELLNYWIIELLNNWKIRIIELLSYWIVELMKRVELSWIIEWLNY